MGYGSWSFLVKAKKELLLSVPTEWPFLLTLPFWLWETVISRGLEAFEALQRWGKWLPFMYNITVDGRLLSGSFWGTGRSLLQVPCSGTYVDNMQLLQPGRWCLNWMRVCKCSRATHSHPMSSTLSGALETHSALARWWHERSTVQSDQCPLEFMLRKRQQFFL